MVTLSDVNDDVRFKTGLNATSLAAADLLRIANKYYRIILRHLVELGEEFFAEISTFDIVASQQEYTLPANSSSTPWGGGVIKAQRLEVSYDAGTTWKVADQVNWEQIDTDTKLSADITGAFSSATPKYAIKDKSLFLFPIPGTSGTACGRLFYIKRPSEMTVTTDVPNITPDFLDVLSTGMTIDVFENLGQTNEKRDALAIFNARLTDMKRQESGRSEDQPLAMRGEKVNYK